MTDTQVGVCDVQSNPNESTVLVANHGMPFYTAPGQLIFKGNNVPLVDFAAKISKGGLNTCDGNAVTGFNFPVNGQSPGASTDPCHLIIRAPQWLPLAHNGDDYEFNEPRYVRTVGPNNVVQAYLGEVRGYNVCNTGTDSVHCEVLQYGPSLFYLGNEGDSMYVGKNQTVLFTSGTRHSQRTISGRFTCNTTTFGDPAPGIRKACYIVNTYHSEIGLLR